MYAQLIHKNHRLAVLGREQTQNPPESMPNPRINAVLSQLPDEDFSKLLAHMKLVSLQKGHILYEPGDKINDYYFPVNCVVELSIDLEDGHEGATSYINMGSIYPLHLIGETQSHNRAKVCTSGMCYKAPAWVVHDVLRRSRSFLWILLAESSKLFEQATLESVCLRHHSIEQTTAKLILMSMDNTQSSEVHCTQQDLANALGARREGVTMALKRFKNQNLISTRRGGLTVLDRAGLEMRACDCYRTLHRMRGSGSLRIPQMSRYTHG